MARSCDLTLSGRYFTEFYQGAKQLGFNQVNMTKFTAGRPDPRVFQVPGRNSGTCADNVCTAYAARRAAGMHPIAAFPGWK